MNVVVDPLEASDKYCTTLEYKVSIFTNSKMAEHLIIKY